MTSTSHYIPYTKQSSYFRYRITVEYCGDMFFGWQRQRQTPTVQAELEDALRIILREPITLFGAGRTDTGVHATAQVAHFDITQPCDCDRVLFGVNHFLRGKGAAIIEMSPAPPDFHARFSAISRHYHYHILNRQAPSVLTHRNAWHINKPLNVERMQEVASLLTGMHDFSAFRDAECQAKNPIRTLDMFTITHDGDIIRAYLKSRAFLHHQVRIMMGTLKRVGQGIWTADDVRDILASKNRARAGQTAPAHGLIFLGPEYPEHIHNHHINSIDT